MTRSTHHRCLHPNNIYFALSFLARYSHPHLSAQYTCKIRPSLDQSAPILPVLKDLRPALVSSRMTSLGCWFVLKGFHFGLELCFCAVSYFPGAS